LALVLGAAAWWLWRYWRKKKAEVPVVPVIPAHIRAKQKLQEALALLGQPREFCILVSDTIRWYLEERFDFRAPERTTEEFLHELRSTNLLTRDQKESLGEFLNRCDLVKFARYEPREPELHDLRDSALRLVEETEPQPEPIVAEGAHAPSTQPQEQERSA
jgi:ABC-type nickel/cobalt efflux system permease component RcnA